MSNTRPAQVLLRDIDRDHQRTLTKRLSELGIVGVGPTLIHRAGIAALLALEDPELATTVRVADTKSDADEINRYFVEWCSRVAADLDAELMIEFRNRDERDTRAGFFSWQGRFVSMSPMPGGKILISGLEAVGPRSLMAPAAPRFSGHLFPESVTPVIGMDERGAQLATFAINTWLLRRDDQLAEVRSAVCANQ